MYAARFVLIVTTVDVDIDVDTAVSVRTACVLNRLQPFDILTMSLWFQASTQNCTRYGDNVNCVLNSYLSATTAYCISLYFILFIVFYCGLLLSSSAVQLCKGRFTNSID